MSNEPWEDALRRLRLNLDLTQEEFGRLINVSTWTISRLETGAALPDLWQYDVILQMHRGRIGKKSRLAVGRFLRTGRSGLALGVLLSGAVRRVEAR